MALLLNANDSVSRSYSITKPSPLHPIMPIGCGERTENLFDINSLYSTVVVQGQTFTKPASAYFFDVFSGSDGGAAPMNLQKSIPVTGGTYTLSFEESETKIAVVFSDGETQTVIAGSSSVTPRTFDVTSDGYVSLRCENPNVCSIKKLQIVKASTALPYEPYGYKLPMVSRGEDSTTIPIYIGDTKLAKDEYVSYSEQKVYKYNGELTLKGDETTIYYYGFFEGVQTFYIDISNNSKIVSGVQPYLSCNYYLKTSIIRPAADKTCRYQSPNTGIWDIGRVYFMDNDYTSLSSFKTHLSELYDAGKPLKVEYVLNNAPISIDPPVPLPALPTTKGSTTFEYDGGEPQPTQMYTKYNSWSGWSDIDNYKMVNGNWTQDVT